MNFYISVRLSHSKLSKQSKTNEQNKSSHIDAVGILAALGDKLVARDPSNTRVIFDDFAIPKLIPLIRSYPSKRISFMHIIYSFCPPDASSHVQLIKSLRERLCFHSDRIGSSGEGSSSSFINAEGLHTFLHCLTFLINFETEFNHDLLLLYRSYCIVGIKHSAPSLRSACLSMISIIARQEFDQVVGMLSILNSMLDDDWWEVNAQLIVACSSLLDHLESHAEKNSDASISLSEQVYMILGKILSRQHSPHIDKIGLISPIPSTKN